MGGKIKLAVEGALENVRREKNRIMNKTRVYNKRYLLNVY